MTEENGADTELLGQSTFHKLTHGFAIRDRLRDVLAEQQAIERQYLRRDNSSEYSSRTAWAEWLLDSDLDYTEAALLLHLDRSLLLNVCRGDRPHRRTAVAGRRRRDR